MTKFLNINVPSLPMDQPVVFIVIMPLDGARVLPTLTPSVPQTAKELVGCVEGVSAMVNPLKFNVPLLTMDQPVEVIVIAPAKGVRALSALTVNAPATENEAAG